MQIKWKIVTLGATLAIGGLFGTPAVNAAPGEKGARREKAGKLAAELGLSATQKTALKSIMQSAKTRREALKADTTLSPEAKREQGKALRADTQTKIAAILTPAQVEKMRELRQNRRGDRPEGGKREGGKRGARRGNAPQV